MYFINRNWLITPVVVNLILKLLLIYRTQMFSLNCRHALVVTMIIERHLVSNVS